MKSELKKIEETEEEEEEEKDVVDAKKVSLNGILQRDLSKIEGYACNQGWEIGLKSKID